MLFVSMQLGDEKSSVKIDIMVVVMKVDEMRRAFSSFYSFSLRDELNQYMKRRWGLGQRKEGGWVLVLCQRERDMSWCFTCFIISVLFPTSFLYAKNRIWMR